MIIYRDRFTNDEMFSDVKKLIPVHDICYEIECQMETDRTDMSKINTGANASQEEAAEEAEDSVRKDLDLVISHNIKLEEVKFKKAEFKKFIKTHLLLVADIICKERGEDAAKSYKLSAQTVCQKILKDYDGYDFYTGESADINVTDSTCAIMFLNYRPDGVTPYFTVFKDDFIQEKV